GLGGERAYLCGVDPRIDIAAVPVEVEEIRAVGPCRSLAGLVAVCRDHPANIKVAGNSEVAGDRAVAGAGDLGVGVVLGRGILRIDRIGQRDYSARVERNVLSDRGLAILGDAVA